jgi:hypothetical protein
MRSSCSASLRQRAGKTSWEAVISSVVAIATFFLGIFTWWDGREQSRTASSSSVEKIVIVSQPAPATPTLTPTPATAPDVEKPEATADPSVTTHALKLSNGDTFYYYRNLSLDEAHPQVNRAIIVIPHYHAPYTAHFFQGVMDLARSEHRDQDTLIVVPTFQTSAECLRPGEPYWPSHWEIGGESAGKQPISSFQVIDELFARVTDPGRFPAMRSVVVAGNSMGGTFVNRYLPAARTIAASGGGKRPIDVTYLMIGADSYLYTDEYRPVAGTDRFAAPDVKTCAGFDSYPFGLGERTGYLRRIATKTLRTNMFSRKAIYVVGTLDTKTDRVDLSGGAMLQGKNRYERASNYWNYIRRFPEWRDNVEFIPLKNMKRVLLVTTDSPRLRALLFGTEPKAGRSAVSRSTGPAAGKPRGSSESGPRRDDAAISGPGRPKDLGSY